MNYLVVGLKRSGVASCKLLDSAGQNVFVFDDNKVIAKELLNAKILPQKTQIIEKLCAKTLKNIDIIVLSPGYSTKKIQKKNKLNIPIISEIELGFLNTQKDILAVTGTNGKTTTVNILNQMLKKQNIKTSLAGNVGIPFCETILEECQKVFVLELSSFQLENVKTFKPNIVGFLNIAKDHLDRYKTFEEYFLAKQKVFKNMTQKDVAVLNYDDKNLRKFSHNLMTQNYYFSLEKLPQNLYGAFKQDNNLIFNFKDKTETICLDKTELKGNHNISNLMCACLMAFLYGVTKTNIQSVVDEFCPLEHRLEFVIEKDGISYYNDSKATNIHSTLNDIKSFNENLVLLLGGSDKGENFDELFLALPTNVSKVVAYGKTGKKIMKSAKKCRFVNCFFAKNLEKAFFKAKDILTNEKIILLSPACASFDEFCGFEERGNFFKSLAKGEL